MNLKRTKSVTIIEHRQEEEEKTLDTHIKFTLSIDSLSEYIESQQEKK